MKKELKHAVAFDLIRYANCWEDADILLEGLEAKPGDKILSIGSAGDNTFSLLITNPSLVVAVDINREQLHLISLKKACFELLTYKEIKEFLGFEFCNNRQALFDKIKPSLEIETANYWESHSAQISLGIIHQGKFEKYFQYFASKILPWIHSKKSTLSLLTEKNEKEQEAFYHKKWNTWRWRLLFKLFFSKYIMGKYGRDPEFLKEVKVPVGQSIFKKAENHLKSTNAQTNFILRYNLTGNFGPLLPHYLKEENFEAIKSNIDKLVILEGYAQEAFKVFGQFNRFNLSNIFEYMDMELFLKTGHDIAENCISGGRIAYWNLLVPRNLGEIHDIKNLTEVSEKLSKKDKGFFYSNFNVCEKC